MRSAPSEQGDYVSEGNCFPLFLVLRLYGWGTLTTHVWLPSLIELVGHDPNQYWEANGCYVSAMQGLNLRINAWIDVKGGTQFAYFRQYNTSGGGQAIMKACNQQRALLRSTYCSHADQIWYLANQTAFYNTSVRTSAHAVHPAVLYNRKKAACS